SSIFFSDKKPKSVRINILLIASYYNTKNYTTFIIDVKEASKLTNSVVDPSIVVSSIGQSVVSVSDWIDEGVDSIELKPASAVDDDDDDDDDVSFSSSIDSRKKKGEDVD